MSKQPTNHDMANISDQLQQLGAKMSLLMEQAIILACASDWNSDGDPQNGWPPSQADLLSVSSSLESIYLDVARITGLDPWRLLHIQEQKY